MSASVTGVKRGKESIVSDTAKRQKGAEAKEEAFVFPADWPPANQDIDLSKQDLPHKTSNTEWWYQNTHLEAKDGREFSLFASFFRLFKEHDEKGNVKHAHTVNWSVVDVKNSRYWPDSLMDFESPRLIKESLEKGNLAMDKRMHRAFMEIIDKGEVPLPDRLMKEDAKVDMDSLNLDYEGQTFVKDKQGQYHLSLNNKDGSTAAKLVFKPEKKPVRQGRDGVVKVGLNRETMFYYYIPRCSVTGTITVKGEEVAVSGTGWYDHEFGGQLPEVGKKNPMSEVDFAWNWLSTQLKDGTDVTATCVVDPKTNEIKEKYMVMVEKDGTRTEYDDITFEIHKESATWQSVRTFQNYPMKWTLKAPSAKLDLEIEAAFPEQEMCTLIANPAFWEGRMHVKGTRDGKDVTGLGFVERHAFHDRDMLNKLSNFFKKVSKVVQGEIRKVLPLKPRYEDIRDLMASEQYDHFMQGANLDVFTKTIIEPIRLIVDRGGKAWRSFSLLLCIDAVGGNSHDQKHWLAMPEIMHCGSLIVDDIQDKSEQRRGGITCHKKYGDAISINAGTAAYFMSLHMLDVRTKDMTPALRLKMYEYTFLTLRAGHAGQAFDINGLDYMMDDVVEKGGGPTLVEAITCTHRLKSAVPAGNLARMGSLVGGGTEEQTEKLGMYFEGIGVAFQIIDDVLNLRGLAGKDKGEDITAGKVTYPVAKGMCVMEQKDRAEMWATIQTKPKDQKVVDSVVEKLEKVGAIDAAVADAEKMVHASWAEVESCLEPSMYKVHLRAFGLYVLDRHY